VVCGPEHQDTLCSVDNLGSLYWTVFQWDKSKQQHTRALEGMLKHPMMGPDHEKTILAKENLAVVIPELGEKYYNEAHEMMLDVVERRTRTMGKEAPWTLLALCNLAVTKHLLGDNSNAEDMLRKGLVIAERNLGVDHHGVLSAKRRLAQILTVQGKFEEAEKLYVYLLDRDHYQGGIRESGPVKGDQKDRIYALYQFVEFWEARKDYKQALTHCHDLCQILHSSIHPIAEMSRDKRDRLRRYVEIVFSIKDL
jgi:tetratricopeptide (TPR) repeat protein